MKNILVTGCAGFIGMHVSKRLLSLKYNVVGIDNLNNYYDIKLKKQRLRILKKYKKFNFITLDIANEKKLKNIFLKYKFKYVINLAAQAGVRFSLQNPQEYIQSNIVGFMNILECSRKYNVQHLLYASTSSVYGLNTKQPFLENDLTDHPVSLYAASKKANEQMAHSYSHLFGLKTSGLRFFTVYGPWGRPDMALFKFTKSILEKRKIEVYNRGNMYRDFTYIDDIVTAIVKVMKILPKKNHKFDSRKPKSSESSAPYQIYNIGNSQAVKLDNCIKILEKVIGKKAIRRNLPMQPGDVYSTKASVKKLIKKTGFRPKTNLETGIKKFVSWYIEHYYSSEKVK
tara:strand:- start:1034 stop:2059 length:1026 start_codon:yes stop_codon:yes gene_type:complete